MNLETIKAFLNGKKTYLIAISAIIAIVIQWADKKIPDQKAVEDIVTAVLAITIRHGVSTSAATQATVAARQRKEETDVEDGIEIHYFNRKG